MKKKIGRPTDSPKEYRITIRLDKECMDILSAYKEKHSATTVESVRVAIRKLQSVLDGDLNDG